MKLIYADEWMENTGQKQTYLLGQMRQTKAQQDN